MLRMVLLPQPEGPRKTRNSPLPGSSRIWRLTFRIASKAFPSGLMKVLLTPRSSSTFWRTSFALLISGFPVEEPLVDQPNDLVRHNPDQENHEDAREDLVHV